MILISAWPGVRLFWTSWPMTCALTPSMKVLDDRQCDVRLEQRHAHLAQRVADVFFGQASTATQALDDARQPGGKLVEHGLEILLERSAPGAFAGGQRIIEMRATFAALLSAGPPWHHAFVHLARQA